MFIGINIVFPVTISVFPAVHHWPLEGFFQVSIPVAGHHPSCFPFRGGTDGVKPLLLQLYFPFICVVHLFVHL